MLIFHNALREVIGDVYNSGGRMVIHNIPLPLLTRLRHFAFDALSASEATMYSEPDILIGWFVESEVDGVLNACFNFLLKLGISDEDTQFQLLSATVRQLVSTIWLALW